MELKKVMFAGSLLTGLVLASCSKNDEDELNNSILSRIEDPEYVILHDRQKIDETIDDTNFHEETIDFFDLRMYISVDNDPYCYYNYKSPSYKNDLNFKNRNRKIHLIEDYEIYKIVHDL